MAITGIRKKQAKPFNFLHGARTVRYEKVPEAGNKMMDEMQPIIDGIKGVLTGPSVWSYRAAGPGKVVLRAGFQVKPGTRGRAPYTSRPESAWSCLSAMYQGPMPEIIAAWEALFEAAEKRGLGVTDERREIYRKWVRFDSRANVTELQLRLQG